MREELESLTAGCLEPEAKPEDTRKATVMKGGRSPMSSRTVSVFCQRSLSSAATAMLLIVDVWER
jgi:hypothetical protein